MWEGGGSQRHGEAERERHRDEEEEREKGRWRGKETELERKRGQETGTKRRRDSGREGEKEQVVRGEGLMSNERLTRPQLILSFYLCSRALLYTEVITTGSSITPLSLLFTGNPLIICYRFVSTRISLCVVHGISSGKHTTSLSAGRSLRIMGGDTSGMQSESGASFFQA